MILRAHDPPSPVTEDDLLEMDARLATGITEHEEDDEDELPTLRLRRRPTDPIDEAVEALDLSAGLSLRTLVAVEGPSGRAPEPWSTRQDSASTPAVSPDTTSPIRDEAGGFFSSLQTEVTAMAPVAADTATAADSTVDLTPEDIEEAWVEEEEVPHQEPPSAPYDPRLDDSLDISADIPDDTLLEGEAEGMASFEDSLDDIVDELLRGDRKDSARRRAQHRRGPAAWWETLFDAAWLELLPPRATRFVAAEAALFVELLQLSPGDRVLDVACGEGRHAIELAKLGLDVVGYDASPDMVAAAERNARGAGVEVGFFVDDMRAPQQVPADFDAAICLGTSFGYFDDATNFGVLEHMRGALKDVRGSLLIHGLARDHVSWRTPERVLWDSGDDLVSEEAEFDPSSSRLKVHKQVVYSDGEVRGWGISVRLYAPHELQGLLEHLGCSSTRVAGPPSFGGHYLGAMCRDLIVIADWK